MAEKKIADRNEQLSITITKEYTAEYPKMTKTAFAAFIREKRKEYNEENPVPLSTKTLGELLGINCEVFRKILNKEKPTQKRDCIIAICFALHLSSGEIDYGLELYNYMPGLDENNPREKLIMDFANVNDRTAYYTVDQLNEQLLLNGFPALDMPGKRKRRNSSVDEASRRYSICNYEVRIPVKRFYDGDPYDSLFWTYSPDQYRCIGDMVIRDSTDEKYIHLIAASDGYMGAYLDDEVLATGYKSLEASGDFKPYFIKLSNAVNMEKQRLVDNLNDTRNYKIRASADLAGNAIRVYAEEFNYFMPELEEYYFLEYHAGKYHLTVYKQSAFMYQYLSENVYRACYGNIIPEEQERYDSSAQIEELISSVKTNTEDHIRFSMRKRAFEKLKEQVDELYARIKNREAFINNMDRIYNEPWEVLRYYEVELDFECRYEEEHGMLSDCLDAKDFILPGGNPVTITLDDIYRAFELGFGSIEEICRIKSELGSVEAVLI